MTDRTYKCRVLVGTTRCSFEGDNEAAGAHWRETGHARCIVCSSFLAADETLTCLRCVGKVRAALLDIVECVTLTSSVQENAAYRGLFLIDLLAMVADGSIESAVQQQHPELYRDVEWVNNPIPVVAALYGIERCWREEFDHTPRMTDATITSCANYLLEWVGRAARTWAGFDDDASTLFELANRLRHAVGVADDPVKGARCLDCDSRLVQPYRHPILPVPDARRSADGLRGQDPEGRDDLWHCRSCKRDYTPAEYHLALRQQALDAQGWAPVRDAADVSGRHVSVIWRWINDGKVQVQRDEDNRVVVWFPDVMAAHNATATRPHTKQQPAAEIA